MYNFLYKNCEFTSEKYFHVPELNENVIESNDYDEECPEIACYGLNEEFNRCGNRCTESCYSFFNDCKNICSPGCFCKQGYRRSRESTTCVPVTECPVSIVEQGNKFKVIIQ